MVKKENLILEKSFTFSLSIIELFKHLKSNNEFIISKQLLRSGTSIGANILVIKCQLHQKKLEKQNIG